MRHAIAIFTAAAAMFIAIAANAVLEQQRKIADARPIPATVLSSVVRESTTTDDKNRKTTTYRPDVHYRYKVGESIFTSSQVFPQIGATTTRARAERIVADNPPGKDITVWYNRTEKNGQTFLLREWDFTPYLTILCAMIFFSVGLGFWAAAPWKRQKVLPPKLSSNDWYEIPIRVSLATRRRPWRVVSAIWFMLGGVAVWHYFTNADRPYELAALIATPIYFVVGLIPLTIYLRHLRRQRAARDARVFVNTQTFRLGKTFNARIEQPFRKPSRIGVLRTGLICDKVERAKVNGKTATRRSIQHEAWTDLKTGEDASPAHPLQAKTKFTPPADQPPTTPPDQSGLPRFTWRLVVERTGAGIADYRADYPIVIGS